MGERLRVKERERGRELKRHRERGRDKICDINSVLFLLDVVFLTPLDTLYSRYLTYKITRLNGCVGCVRH